MKGKAIHVIAMGKAAHRGSDPGDVTKAGDDDTAESGLVMEAAA